MNKKTWTVLEIIDWSRNYLAEKGFENARLETELLLGHALSLPRIELYLNFERRMSESELARYKALLKRRLAGEPVQYVTGTAAFMFSEFEVNPAVLIPRPETEALTEVALGMIGEGTAGVGANGVAGRATPASGPEPASVIGGSAPEGGIRVADIGTGSGVIAVTIAQKRPAAAVYATDASTAALEVARRNAERAGVGERIAFLEGPLFEPLRAQGLSGRLSLIVSNPPYVRSGDIDDLDPEVRDFEPRTALDGGPDGLDYLRKIAQDGPALLAPGGAVALEVGDGQAPAVADMLGRSLTGVEVRRDYAGRDRIVTGRKAG
jgi:release factor glutamine methyltransferase